MCSQISKQRFRRPNLMLICDQIRPLIIITSDLQSEIDESKPYAREVLICRLLVGAKVGISAERCLELFPTTTLV